MAAGKGEYPQAELALDDVNDLGADILLGGGGEALHRWYIALLCLCKLTDKTDGIEVIGSEIVAPFGEAVGLVKDPGADLALGNGGAERGIAQLLRRHQQDADIAQPHPFQHLGPLGQGEHAGERCGDLGAGEAGEVIDLIFHQRLQGRDDDGQQITALVAHQRRQ